MSHGPAKEKNRQAESEDIDKTLRDAGFTDDEDLQHLEKKQMLQALNESLQMHQEAEAVRTTRRNLSLTTKGGNTQRQGRQAKQEKHPIPNVEVKKEESDESPSREETASPEIFDNSQDNPIFLTSPFLDCSAVAASESDDETADQSQAPASTADEIFHSDCDEEEVIRAITSKTEHIPSPAFMIDEESSHSYKSACDDVRVTRHTPLAMESHVPFDSRPNSLIQLDTRRLLSINVLNCAMVNEPTPFYEQLLSLRQRGNYTRLPLYYDPLLNMTKEEHMRRVSQELGKNAVLMAEMQLRQKPQQESKKWAPPIKACGDKNIETLDKKLNSEPEKCSQLPWGERPVVLDYTYKPDKPVTPSFSYRESMKLPGRPKVSVSLAAPGPSGIKSIMTPGSSFNLSNSRGAKMIGMVPLIKKYEIDANTTQANKNVGNERQPRESAKKSSDTLAALDDDDDDTDQDWTQTKQKGRRGKGKGNRGARGGGVNRGRGRGGKGRGVEDLPPPVVGLQFPIVGTKNQAEAARVMPPNADTEEDILTSNHSTSNSFQSGTICPICNKRYPQATILAHAATCGDEGNPNPPPECCNVCNTIIPVGMMEKHKTKCEQKQRNLRSGHLGAAAALPSVSYRSPPHVVELDDLISEDDTDENDTEPPAKRCRSQEF